MAAYRQEVKNKPFGNLSGILFILGIVVFLYCLGVILAAFQRTFGMSYGTASTIVWVVGGAVTLLMMQDRVLSYHYTLDGSNLKLDRIYGKYMRPARTIMFRMIEDFGTPEEMAKKYPGSHRERYTRRQCDLPEMAIVHIADKKRYISVIQPDETIRTALENRSGAQK